MHRCIRVEFDGKYEGCLCSECMGLHIKTLAYTDRAAFEQLVEEARAYQPPTSHED